METDEAGLKRMRYYPLPDDPRKLVQPIIDHMDTIPPATRLSPAEADMQAVIGPWRVERARRRRGAP